MTGSILKGFLHPDGVGQGQRMDEQGRVMAALAPNSGLRFNSDDEIDFDLKEHPEVKRLLQRIAALERKVNV